MSPPTVVHKRGPKGLAEQLQQAVAEPAPTPASIIAGPTRSPRVATLDELNQALKAAEAHLYNLNVGVGGALQILAEDDHGPGYYYELNWGKLGPRWCLYITEGPGDEPDMRVTQLEQAPAHVRRLAAEKLPELLGVLADNAEREVASFQEATQAALRFARGEFDGVLKNRRGSK